MATNSTTPATIERCTLLNGTFNNLIQVMLGLIALSVLIFKRYHERPRRPLRIWMFDASKQLIGAGVAHAANLAIAITLSGLAKGQTGADQCAFYFVNFTLDTTFGVAVNYLLLKALVYFAVKYNVTALQVPGDYGHPIQVRVWAIQLVTWLVIICSTKILIGAVIFGLETPLGDVAAWLFSPFGDLPKVELVIVMVACPVLMNGLQFWVLLMCILL
ncbi:hypothetical protein, variant [Aphanomyces astaci]|uniref:Uncharacterized protein n=2 Tax=Aphanomyces astaci TaxID=112090 RepID=W4G5C9_APHAT|nr:hypothetical protein, variant [Aphanomyces astaci]ETV74922.1 hypothetical protein, variant [Aphanomyces astaci]RHY22035.1 hypothetical protein DYB25_006613 [Aphanomyces astaci]RHY43295.1 hypothetical protein DYB38_011932 [Aphanomyces astaci]RHY86713.1 hypothetical protein DYB31_013421 [Aphanomyces astaci]|eukprot:XP_009835425.1 hypothetical protein, variant [Aphanomyces astaci]